MNENLENEIKNDNFDSQGDLPASSGKKKFKARRVKEEYSEASGKNYGIILSFLLSLSAKIENGLKTGFFGKIFASSYNTEDRALKNGLVGTAVENVALKNGKRLKIRNKISSLYERSLFSRIIAVIIRFLVNSYLRLWGMFLLTLGTMVEVVLVLKLITAGVPLDFQSVFVGIGIAILSLPLLLSSRQLGDALLEGRITRRLVLDFAGISEEKLDSDSKAPTGYYSIAFLIGAVLGLTSYLVSPMVYLFAIFAVILVGAIMVSPEAGLLLTIVLIPFVSIFENPSIMLAALLGIDTFSFFFKWLRGKRLIKFEIIDIFVLIFGLLMLFGGIISSGGRASFNSALLYFGFIVAYFLAVNMIRKRGFVRKTRKLIAFSSTLIALIGILEQGKGFVNPSWVDMSLFSGIGNRVTSLFDNPNMLSIYLVIAFPFVLCEVLLAKKLKERLIYLICTLSILVCTVFTWSRGAWLGLIVGACVFLVCYNIKTIWAILGVLFTAPLWTMLLPSTVLQRAASIGSLTDSSTFYRIYTWKGVLKMLEDYFFSGIGVGESAFTEVFPLYSYAGTEYVMHSHNLYLEIAVQIGIVGLLIFLAILLLYAQKCFEHIKTTNNQNSLRITVIAGLSSIVGASVMGLTDYIWYNYRVFLFFWIVMGITCAAIRINNWNSAKSKAGNIQNDRMATFDIEQ